MQVIERDTHEHHRIKVSSGHRDIEQLLHGPDADDSRRPSQHSQTTIPVHHTVVEAPIVHASVQHEPLSLKE